MKPPPNPRITIVTPSYNQGEFVESTIRSIFDQRYDNLEYIFMDGGSTDSTLERITPYMDRFAHFESGPDGGQSAAIAKGFDRSSGEIMAYLNSDDVLLPGTLNFVANYFRENPEIDFVYGHRCIINETNEVIGHWILPPHSSFLMRRWDLIPQESCFWRRRLFEQKGNVDPSYRFAMDYDLFVRYMDGGRFQRVNRFLAAFRIHDTAKTSTLLNSVGYEEVARIYQQYRIQPIPLLGRLFPLSVRLRSAWYLRRRLSYPGLPPSWGFKWDELWGANQSSSASKER